MRFTQLSFLGLVLAGCEPTYDYQGYDMPDHFPLDGSELQWEYASTDEAVTDELRVEKLEASIVDDVEVVTLEHWLIGEDDTEDLAWSVRWASDSVKGVLIYGYTDVANDNEVTFDPPIVFAEGHGIPGSDPIVTQTGGFTWTATFEAVEGCETYWVPGWADEPCLRISLDDGDSTEVTNSIIVGSYWLVPRYGSAWLELDAYDARWSLADHDWEE
jgi:hypothetical protein